jgi:hypothetical protein
MKESMGCRGDVEVVVESDSRVVERLEFRNTILRTGREALALSLANRTGGDFDFFVSRMLFGDGGANSGVPKSVQTDRTSLFGTTRVSKPVIANIDPNNGSQVVFTSVVSYDEGNGFSLNEMALQLHGSVPSGSSSPSLYSMATFPGISKTSLMQLTFNWRISFI